MSRLLLTAFISCLLMSGQQRNGTDLAHEAVEAERRGDFAGAISAFKELIASGAESPELRSNLGIAYFQLREFHDALREFHPALTEDPHSVPANLFSVYLC